MGTRWLAASALAVVAVPASGYAQSFNNYNPLLQSGTFGNNGSIGNTTFTNTFTFVVTRAGTLATDFSNTSTGIPTVPNGGTSDIDFSGATLSGGSLVTPQTYTKLVGEPVSRTEVWEVTNPILLGAGTYTLSINGRSYGNQATYTGNFSVTPVPEVATWAMMIGGIGVVGGLQRRRRSVTAKVRFA